MSYMNYNTGYRTFTTPGVDPTKQRPITPCERSHISYEDYYAKERIEAERDYKYYLNSIYGVGAFFRGIKKVIFNDPATIVLWADGTKTVVKCQDGDVFDPEKGLAMAISKKCFGNMGRYYEVFKKWLPEEEGVEEETDINIFLDGMSDE